MAHSNSVVSSTSSASSAWQNEVERGDEQLFFVTSYTDFEKLAHGPRGTEAKKHSLYVYKFSPSDGSLVLLNIHGQGKVKNPAFSRFHPRLNVVYTCTEDIEDNGLIFAYAINSNGQLEQLGEPVDAGGTSTCYLTIDRARQNMIAVNYWNSTLTVIPLDPETGAFTGPIKSVYDPNAGKQMVAAAKKDGGVNHSCNDDSTIRQRQADPHSHALVLDPYVGAVAYVPDLGKDLIREFYYNRKGGAIESELNIMPSGLSTGKPDGPRYFEFHPKYNVAYVVNELSSTIAVFEVDRALLNEISTAANNDEDMTRFKGRTTLRLIQSISTIPDAFPTDMNTCGRICVHKSGRFVVVSNRGHQSITVFRVLKNGSKRGHLHTVGQFHTRGETPRHFKFDNSGQYLLVANQDSDTIAVFSFNLSSGELKYTGNEYGIPSPNFICSCPIKSSEQLLGNNASEQVQVGGRVITRQGSQSSSASESDDSTILASSSNNKKDDMTTTLHLQSELAKAHEEIAQLKKLLAERV